jgi:hypothetical protein
MTDDQTVIEDDEPPESPKNDPVPEPDDDAGKSRTPPRDNP